MTQQNETETLNALEHLMNEFFNPHTGNIRKREIESQLESFSNQRDSWKLCLYFMTHSENHYVCMYSMTSIESTINRQWTGFTWENRTQLKSEIWQYLTRQYASNTNTNPTFLRNKLAKLIVDIARHDWPHFYPDFFNNIIELLHSEQGRVLGLILLRTASEELGKPRDDLSSLRRVELSRLMQMHANPVLQNLTILLQNIACKKGITATKTPPPSPTHPSYVPKTPSLSEASTLRPDSREICFEVLMALQHIFSWVPLTEINTSLIKTIFHFATSMSYTQEDDNICVLSLTTLSELLYRKAIPPNCEPLLLELSSGAMQLLSHIVNDSSVNSLMESLSNSFIEKLTEFLQLLIEVHLHRLEANSTFPIIDFINLLFRYTFQQTTICQFIPCLGIWTSFLKQIKPKNDVIRSTNKGFGKLDSPFKYSDIVYGLTNGVLNKIQYQFNHSELNDLDTEVHENEIESEFQQFICQSIELLALVAEIVPLHLLNLVASSWYQRCEIYLRLSSSLDQMNHKLNIENKEQETQLHFVLKDFVTLTQLLSRLATCFMDEEEDHFQSSVDTVKNFFSKLVTTLFYSIEYRLYNVQTTLLLHSDLVEVISNLFTGITSWCLWPLFRTDIRSGQLGCELIQCCVQLFLVSHSAQTNEQLVPDSLIRFVALLFLRLSTMSSPEVFLSLTSMSELIQCASINSKLESETAGIIRHALCNVAINQNTNSNISENSLRSQLLANLVEGLVGPLRNLQMERIDPQQAKTIVESIIPQYISFIDQYRNHNSAVKKLLCSGIKESVEILLLSYPRYANYGEINDCILALFLTVLGVLRQQLGVEFTKKTVQIFLDVTLSKQNDSNVSGMDKLLQILQLIVEEPGISFRCLLPSVIGLCLQTALPIVVTRTSELPDLATALFKLLHSILLNRWQFFNQSQVRLGHSPGASDTLMREDVLQNSEQLIEILQAFGNALLQSDINIFKLSLTCLENLNVKWKLYHNELFRKQLLSQFLTVLLQSLLAKSHALLADEITLAICNMATVDFQAFVFTFLPNFLNGTEGLDDHQKETLLRNFSHESDTPTLSQNVSRLITDMRCYRICNACLQPGTVLL